MLPGGPCIDGSKLLQAIRPDYARRDGEELTDSYDWKGCPDDLPNGTVALGLTPTVRYPVALLLNSAKHVCRCFGLSQHAISRSVQTHIISLIKLKSKTIHQEGLRKHTIVC